MRLEKTLALLGLLGLVVACGNAGVDGEVNVAKCEGKVSGVDVCSVVTGTDSCADGFTGVEKCNTNKTRAKCLNVKIDQMEATLFFTDEGSEARAVCETNYQGTWSTDI